MSRRRSDNWLPELMSNSCVLLQRGRHLWARDCVSWSFLSWTPLRSPILQNGLTGLQAGAVCVPILKDFSSQHADLCFLLLFLLCVHPDTSSQSGSFLSDTQRLGFPTVEWKQLFFCAGFLHFLILLSSTKSTSSTA